MSQKSAFYDFISLVLWHLHRPCLIDVFFFFQFRFPAGRSCFLSCLFCSPHVSAVRLKTLFFSEQYHCASNVDSDMVIFLAWGGISGSRTGILRLRAFFGGYVFLFYSLTLHLGSVVHQRDV
jgi:hypothetical protein